MKKSFLLVCVVITIMFTSCGYSKEDLARAESKGYAAGFEEGYDLAKYEAKGELESAMYNQDSAYEAGYERGYEEGYDDCLVDHGLYNESYHGYGRIEKDD